MLRRLVFITRLEQSIKNTNIAELTRGAINSFSMASKMRVFWSTRPQVEPSSALAQASVKKASTI